MQIKVKFLKKTKILKLKHGINIYKQHHIMYLFNLRAQYYLNKNFYLILLVK